VKFVAHSRSLIVLYFFVLIQAALSIYFQECTVPHPSHNAVSVFTSVFTLPRFYVNFHFTWTFRNVYIVWPHFSRDSISW